MRVGRIFFWVWAGTSFAGCASSKSSDDTPNGMGGTASVGSGGSAGRAAGGTGAASGSGTMASGGSGSGDSCAEVERCCPRYTAELDRQRCDGTVIVGDEMACRLFLSLARDTCGNAGMGGMAGGSTGRGGAGGSGGSPEVDCGAVVHEGDAKVNSPAALAPLAGVTEITGSLDLSGFTGTELGGLASLRCVRLGIAMHSTSLRGTQALDGLRSVGNLSIRQNAALQRVDGFSALVKATVVTVVANPTLTEIAGFGVLASAGVSLRENPQLARVSGFSALNAAPAGLDLSDNPSLTDLSGFSQLVDAQSLNIRMHDALENLESFGALRLVRSVFRIENNDSLTSLAGLASFESTAGLSVQSNPKLPDCDVQAFVTRVTISGTPMIDGNLTDSCTQ